MAGSIVPRSLSGLACGSPRAGSVVCARGYGGDDDDNDDKNSELEVQFQ